MCARAGAATKVVTDASASYWVATEVIRMAHMLAIGDFQRKQYVVIAAQAATQCEAKYSRKQNVSSD
jgi:hypothetical protein